MRDSRRRNRNIGTAKAGHGSNNRLRIPDRWSDLAIYWEKLTHYVAVEKPLDGRSIVFLVEQPRKGNFHHCTIQDVLTVLGLLPQNHVEHIELIVFRQPTVKQARLASVWGRLAYWSEIGKYSGPGIYLESQPATAAWRWKKSLRPDDAAELERLRRSGFEVTKTKRGYDLLSTPAAIRASQLYRTLPHEVGHYADYLQSQEKFNCGDDFERFWELYGAKPSREKEVFAHRYADQFWQEMKRIGKIPFEPIVDHDEMLQDRVDPDWFLVP